MSVTTTVNQINTQTLAYLPAVIAGVQAVEAIAPGLPGETKLQAVLDGIAAAAAASGTELAKSPNSTVASIGTLATLAGLVVGIFNSLGVFTHKAAAPPAQ